MKRTSILARLNAVFNSIAALVLLIATLFAFTSYQIQSVSDKTLTLDFPLEAAAETMSVAHKSMQSNVAEYLLGDYSQKAKYRDNLDKLKQSQQHIINQQLLSSDQQVALYEQITQLTQSINTRYIEQIFDRYNPSYEQAAKNIADTLITRVGIPLEAIIDSRAQDEIRGANLSSDENELRNDDIPAIQYYLQLVDEAGDMYNALSRYLLNDISSKQDFERNAENFKQWFELLKPLEQDPDEIKDLQVIEHHFNTLIKDGHRLFELYDPGKYTQAMYTFTDMKQNELAQIEALLLKLTLSAQKQVSEQLAQLSFINKLSSFLLITLSVIAIVILISMKYFARKTIYHPIATLADAVEQLRQGKRDIDLQHNNDELGDVFNNVAQLQQDLQQLDILQEQQKLHKHHLEQERDKLQAALSDLELAKDKLVTNEKMASLGALVAGVSHEINTPIGIAVTMSSTFDNNMRRFLEQAKNGDATLEDLVEFETESLEGLAIMQRALNQAAELIHSFKQVAIDQSSEVKRQFNLHEVLSEVFHTLQHQIKNTQYSVKLDCDQSITLNSYPGPLGQVITNLFNNAIIHGFDGRDQGLIALTVSQKNAHTVHIDFRDNGNGIAKDNLNKIFDPFFTTKLGKGSSGLGMNIAYNIVNSVLGGDVSIHSSQADEDHGTLFTIIIPIEAP
ncbi:sensor histidine kinase [Shewanella maritima]|uniref:sensor histidine kinase n=1 Tax=Shewanella maritima TaxID=2520507 RepID=UPI003735E0B3